MLARSARSKRTRESLRIPKKKSACGSTPIVVDRGRRVNANSTKRINPKTVRSKRRNKVRVWQEAAVKKFSQQPTANSQKLKAN